MAGQGNNAAVGHHFGTRADLVRAIVRAHTERVELLRRRLPAEAEGSGDVRDWVGCLVRSFTGHLDDLGAPTRYARFAAQVMTDPALRLIMAEDALNSPTLRRVVDGLRRCLPELPPEVHAERADMAGLLVVPYADHGFCQENSQVIVKRNVSPEERAAAGGRLTDYVDGLVADKLAHPCDDLLSKVAAQVTAGELTRQEAARMGVLLLVAGHETTADMIALGTLALLQHPDQLALLRGSDDPALVAGAVEELPAAGPHGAAGRLCHPLPADPHPRPGDGPGPDPVQARRPGVRGLRTSRHVVTRGSARRAGAGITVGVRTWSGTPSEADPSGR
ncbi:hypothetical protein AB0G05_23710 [Nonomuraea wenchangensis]